MSNDTVLDIRIRNLKTIIANHNYRIKKHNYSDNSILELYVKSYQEELEGLEFIRGTLCQG